MVLTVINILMA